VDVIRTAVSAGCAGRFQIEHLCQPANCCMQPGAPAHQPQEVCHHLHGGQVGGELLVGALVQRQLEVLQVGVVGPAGRGRRRGQTSGISQALWEQLSRCWQPAAGRGLLLCGLQTRRQHGCCPPLLGAQAHPHPLGGPAPVHRHAVLVEDGGERLGVGRRLVGVRGELAHAVAAIGAEGEAAGVGAEVQAHLCGGLAGRRRGSAGESAWRCVRPGLQRARTTMKRSAGSCTPPPSCAMLVCFGWLGAALVRGGLAAASLLPSAARGGGVPDMLDSIARAGPCSSLP
jgi:hypothetical protein